MSMKKNGMAWTIVLTLMIAGLAGCLGGDDEEEVEEKPQVTRSPGGKTFRRKREEEVSEAMTPAEAILRSSAVNPDLDKALALVKGLM